MKRWVHAVDTSSNTYNYKIYQIQWHRDDAHHPWMFMGIDFARKHGFTFDDYAEVYSGTIESESVDYALEDLFEIFNIDRPADFKGHSLSVSDIIEINGEYYYCDSFGFVNVTKFLNSKKSVTSSSDLTHLFEVGQKVKCKIADDLDPSVCTMYNGTVKETYPDHIIVDIPEVSDHCWFETGYNIGDVYPDYNFA